MLTCSPHPLLEVGAFITHLSLPLSESPEWLRQLLSPDAAAPLAPDDEVRAAVRDMLRHFGYKPTGRGKPASEYLLRGVPTISVAVDVANAVSLHSGLPISVVDLDRTRPPLQVNVAGEGQSYVFNSAGQVIEVKGLPCLFDADGPCANAVKDAQRTKTNAETRNTLSIVWGARSLLSRTERAVAWYRELLGRTGAATESIV
jgi:DNA/RNA-binding domain of Phe-tRNA-synthetase-like protein